MNRINKLVDWMFLIAFVLIGNNAYANEMIIPLAGQNNEVGIISGLKSGDFDLLKIRPANESGISVNKFSDFMVYSDRALHILNTAKIVEGETIPAARSIVIEGVDISLAGTIKIIGVAANLVFMNSNNSNNNFNCNDCSIENVHRLSFIAGERINQVSGETLAVDTSMQAIGAVNTSGRGPAFYLTNLRASGAMSVELIAERVFLNGNIETRTFASKGENGAIFNSEDGEYTIGATSLIMVLGALIWDYDSKNLLEVLTDNNSWQDFQGSYYAASTKIWVAGRFSMDASVNTTSDYISSIKYGEKTATGISNEPYIVEEGYAFQAMHKDYENEYNGRVYSNGNVLIRSMGSLEFRVGGAVALSSFGKNIEIIANGNVSNKGVIAGESVSIAAGSIQNTGLISAETELEIYAEDNIDNHFGGELVGERVLIQSENGIFRNGSRTPYLNISDNMSRFKLASSDLVIGNSYKIGTYFQDGNEVDFSNNPRVPEYTHSQVLGQNVRIVAQAIENINPFWFEVGSADNYIDENNSFAAVGIRANDTLQLKTNDYLINSSASLSAVNELNIDSPIVINDRYKVLSILESNLVDAFDYQSDSSTYIAANSPPGLIMSLGKFTLKADIGFTNKSSNFEVYGDAEFYTNSLKHYGIFEGQSYSYSIDRYYHTTTEYCLKKVNLVFGYGWIPGECTKRSIREHLPELEFSFPAKQLESLFYIGGHAYGRKLVGSGDSQVLGERIDLYASAIDAYEAYVEEMLEGIFNLDGIDGYNENYSVIYEGNEIKTTQNLRSFDHCDPNAPDILIPIDVAGITIFIPVEDCQVEIKTKTNIYAFMNELDKYYESIKAQLQEWIDLLDWWSTENV